MKACLIPGSMVFELKLKTSWVPADSLPKLSIVIHRKVPPTGHLFRRKETICHEPEMPHTPSVFCQRKRNEYSPVKVKDKRVKV